MQNRAEEQHLKKNNFRKDKNKAVTLKLSTVLVLDVHDKCHRK